MNLPLRTCSAVALFLGASLLPAQTTPPQPALKQFCFGCHGKAAMAGLNLEQLSKEGSFGEQFQHWERVISVLEEKRMPPPKMPQPTDEQRQQAIAWVNGNLDEYVKKHAGDPGRVTVRRLTSGEYAYTIRDLTGLDMKFEGDLATDSAGGEGFTNFGDVQFMQDAGLERYLEAAKKVASHAVIGAGPLQFYEHGGRSGFELSAITRIQDIYRKYGFRAVAGEGGKPFGLDRYSKAFFVVWQFRHRQALGLGKATLDELAAKEGITGRFAQHINGLMTSPTATYPISEIAAKWRAFPAGDAPEAVTAARTASVDLQKFTIDWTRMLFAAPPALQSAIGDDALYEITDKTIQANLKQPVRFLFRTDQRGQQAKKTMRVYLMAQVMNPGAKDAPVVVFRNGVIRPRSRGPQAPVGDTAGGGAAGAQNRRPRPSDIPILSVLDGETVKRLGFGKRPDGAAIGENALAVRAGESVSFDVPVPETNFGFEVQFEAELLAEEAGDVVLRCMLSDQADPSKGRAGYTFLADAKGLGYQNWKKGLLDFAEQMPQVAQGEGAPSDRDPILPVFDNTYNNKERDHFHTSIKYFRADKFLYDKILDDASRKKLDVAWNDLFSSFEYHNLVLRFIANKYNLEPLKTKAIGELTPADIETLPAEPKRYVADLRAEYDAVRKAQRAARPGHLEDALRFASDAWRRPLTKTEQDGLRAFYQKARSGPELDHDKAIQALLTRVLVSPAFLYRLEQPAQVAGERPLSSWEMASRLSYFLWSSAPDAELRRVAAAGQLKAPEQIEAQVKRMLADPKAKRFATEFFGQWLGFYQFDRHKGVDPVRFPEFNDEVKSAMYDEAISFFEHIVRNGRPVSEMYTANYTFANQALAKHYGIKKEVKSKDDPELIEGADQYKRGGLLRLGAVLTATSAPLRTSPVKRGDWVLRRILGTPTPPPPADAGSLPSDDKAFGGMSVFERLEAHKRNPTCASCHTRIDPLGFPLERFDAVGRWRDTYADGKPVHDSAALADKTPVNGIEGLLAYLKSQEKQVMKTMSQKLLGYALGRTVLASDQPLIAEMTKEGSNVSMAKLAAQIATSRQFRYRREPVEPAPPRPASNSEVKQSAKRSLPLKEGGL
ncbi:MAG TPA: DUF1592 domain-containing protein [Bryobacteraceae bacterium]|nr:DUF1592 domain-containing protein [Bryobacteraceae bacterium]